MRAKWVLNCDNASLIHAPDSMMCRPFRQHSGIPDYVRRMLPGSCLYVQVQHTMCARFSVSGLPSFLPCDRAQPYHQVRASPSCRSAPRENRSAQHGRDPGDREECGAHNANHEVERVDIERRAHVETLGFMSATCQPEILKITGPGNQSPDMSTCSRYEFFPLAFSVQGYGGAVRPGRYHLALSSKEQDSAHHT